MKIINLLTFLVIYVSAENPYNSSAARMRSVDLLSLISGKGPGQVQTFLEDYTPQIHDHSHKHKYKHKHAHQHRLVVKENCRSAGQKCRNHKIKDSGSDFHFAKMYLPCSHESEHTATHTHVADHSHTHAHVHRLVISLSWFR